MRHVADCVRQSLATWPRPLSTPPSPPSSPFYCPLSFPWLLQNFAYLKWRRQAQSPAATEKQISLSCGCHKCCVLLLPHSAAVAAAAGSAYCCNYCCNLAALQFHKFPHCTRHLAILMARPPRINYPCKCRLSKQRERATEKERESDNTQRE